MPIRFSCPACDKSLKAPDGFAGEQLPCPGCETSVTVPQKSQRSRSRTATPNPRRRRPSEETESKSSHRPAGGASKPSKKKSRRSQSTGQYRLLVGALVVSLLPLIYVTVLPGRSAEERFEQTAQQNPNVFAELEAWIESEETSGEFDLFTRLPDQRLSGAHLSRTSWMHWLYALLSTGVFLGMILILTPRAEASVGGLLTAGLVTGTVGIVLLLGFQWVADATQGFMFTGHSIITVLFYIVKFIGFSYRSAVQEGNGFLLSFMGFTCGVGLCEELCKAIPVVLFLQSTPNASWRAALAIGLASGVGFGVSEGIAYSSDFYNGVSTGSIYVVRFVSCVGLHAMWAGAVALLMQANHDHMELSWDSVWQFVVFYLGIAMILHGLYDTLLKQELNLGALAIAGLSIGWLYWLINQRRATDE